MDIQIKPSLLKGAVRAVASKSCAHRLLILSALADAPCRVEIGQVSEDIEATARCLRALGARIEEDRGVFQVTPIDWEQPVHTTLDCGESGSTLRFLLPLAARLHPGSQIRFEGHGRLPERPNTALTQAMRLHGVEVSADFLPIEVQGNLTGGVYELPGNVSSQFITGLLMALPTWNEDSEIRFTTKVESESYIDLTISAMKVFGLRVDRTEQGYFIPGGQVIHAPDTVRAEGDWSNAAFFLAAGFLGNEVEVTNLDRNSAQGDRAIVRVLEELKQPGGHIVDAADIPDLVPILSVAATQAAGTTEFVNAGRLRIKECDRLSAMHQCLSALGADVTETKEGLIVRGGRKLTGGTVSSFGDHRIVMSMAVAATVAEGPVTICGAQAVAKSYPTFFEDYQALGGDVRVLTGAEV